jgi:LysM repeat protein
VEEVDRKRLDDYKKIETAIANLGTKLAPVTPSNGKDKDRHSTGGKNNSGGDKGDKSSGDSTGTEKAPANEKGFKYTIKNGDTISAIIQAYKDQNIKVTEKDILKANPGLVPEKMKVGQEIFIPAPPTGKKETALKD